MAVVLARRQIPAGQLDRDVAARRRDHEPRDVLERRVDPTPRIQGRGQTPPQKKWGGVRPLPSFGDAEEKKWGGV